MEEKKEFMTFEKALSIVRELSRSQGFYCRLLQELEWIKRTIENK